MKIDELKLRLHKFVNNTIDLYLPPTSFMEKLANSTAKLWIDQNAWRLNKVLDSFGDEYGEIDADSILEHYEKTLFENGELRLDIKGMIPESMQLLKDALPNKIILFKTEDFRNIFKS
jgi:hypothetical protein